jgi:uncharacterized delta-60 repeat protein
VFRCFVPTRQASVLAVCVWCSPLAAVARPGEFDPGFGKKGAEFTAINVANGVLATGGVVVQADGKILVAFPAVDSVLGSVFGVARFLADGKLDLGFGRKGVATAPFMGAPTLLAVGTDGGLLVGGVTDIVSGEPSGGYIVRFSRDGVFDKGFGGSGQVTPALPLLAGVNGAFGPETLLVQPDGRILLGGLADYGGRHGTIESAVARLNADGTADTHFGTDGSVVGLPSDAAGIIGAVALGLQDNGDIRVVTGGPGNGTTAEARLLPDGSAAPGDTPAALPATSQGGLVSLDADADMVSALTVGIRHTDASYVEVVRALPDGGADPSYGTVQVSYNQNDAMPESVASAFLVLPDKSQIVAGSAEVVGTLGIAHLLPGGGLDPAFGQDGTVIGRYAPKLRYSTVIGLARQADGKVVGAGVAYYPRGGDSVRLGLFRVLMR